MVATGGFSEDVDTEVTLIPARPNKDHTTKEEKYTDAEMTAADSPPSTAIDPFTKHGKVELRVVLL